VIDAALSASATDGRHDSEEIVSAWRRSVRPHAIPIRLPSQGLTSYLTNVRDEFQDPILQRRRRSRGPDWTAGRHCRIKEARQNGNHTGRTGYRALFQERGR
jgi:hypothetical protein